MITVKVKLDKVTISLLRLIRTKMDLKFKKTINVSVIMYNNFNSVFSDLFRVF